MVMIVVAINLNDGLLSGVNGSSTVIIGQNGGENETGIRAGIDNAYTRGTLLIWMWANNKIVIIIKQYGIW